MCARHYAIAALAAVIVLMIVVMRDRDKKAQFIGGDANLQLYDVARYYPHFVRPARWDSEKACAGYCSGSSCTIWCR